MGALRSCAALGAVLALGFAAAWRYVVLCPLALTPEDLTGKRIIVTGGTSGIGRKTVEKLVEWNATVVLPVRSLPRGEKVKTNILSGLPTASTGAIELLECDLASLQSVRSFADAYIASGKQLDVLLLNAGMMGDPAKLERTVDGIEAVFQTNFLAHFFLTRLLTPVLLRSAPSRVVHVSSVMHYLGHLDKVAYSAKNRNADPQTARPSMSYSDTKLMQVVFSNYYHSKYGQQGVSSIALHPGFVMTEIDKHLPPPWGEAILWFRKQTARSTEEGAITQLTAATSSNMSSHFGGTYLEDRCISSLCTWDGVPGVKPSSAARDLEQQRWLWETSSDIVGLEP